MGGGDFGAHAAAGHQHLDGKRADCADRADHRQAECGEQNRGDGRVLQGADEQGQHRGAGQRAGNGAEHDRNIEDDGPAVQMPEIQAKIPGDDAIVVAVSRLADQIGDARKPGRKHVQQSGDAGQQKDRRQRHLDDVGDEVERCDRCREAGHVLRVAWRALRPPYTAPRCAPNHRRIMAGLRPGRRIILPSVALPRREDGSARPRSPVGSLIEPKYGSGPASVCKIRDELAIARKQSRHPGEDWDPRFVYSGFSVKYNNLLTIVPRSDGPRPEFIIGPCTARTRGPGRRANEWR